jgi:uncharacterized protein (UPF0335 family)
MEGAMASDKMIQEAWAEYISLHEDAKRVYANAKKYQQLHSWLNQTFTLFPSAFEGLTTEIPAPNLEVQPLPEIPPAKPTTPALGGMETLGALTGMALGAVQDFQQGLSLSIRRKLNEKAIEQVERILQERGKQHFDTIIELMKENGWQGYPLDDTRALYNALQTRARNEDRFVNEGENYWSLRSEVK